MRAIGEVVLIYFQDKPSVYARIENIEPDIKRDWYRITFLLLTFPARAVTWILRESYIDGDPFTMDSMPVRIEEVKVTPLENEHEGPAASGDANGIQKKGKVVPFKRK